MAEQPEAANTKDSLIASDTRPLPPGLPRAVEIAIAVAGLLLCSPLLAIVAIWVRLSSPGPAIFKQVRIGRNGTAFTLYKFRTMRVHEAAHGVTARGDPRVTTIGRILRATKLDELPELWNIACGNMSFVGPRPEVPRYVNLDDALWKSILRARPGVTDPMTQRLRNEEELMASAGADAERFYVETLLPYKLIGSIAYLQQRSWRTDVWVILRTLVVIAAPGVAPPPPLEEIRGFTQSIDVPESARR